MRAGRPTDGANAYWAQAIEKWKVDGRPVEVQVELRPPFRVDGFGEEEQGYSQDVDHDGGVRWRPSLAVGPIEGFRPHLDLELNLGYRYNQPTVSTIRVGAPSPTQGWGAGVRQQDTSILSRFNLSVGTLDNNQAKVHDLTDPDSWWSGSQFTLYNGRLYLDVGNRNRVRIDGTKGSVYARMRETGFVELGLGADFVRYAYGDNQFFSINGYYELQWYPLDYRNQVTLSGGAITKSQGFQPYPLFEIDPALQISWTEPPRIVEDRIPDQNPEDRGLSWLTSETR